MAYVVSLTVRAERDLAEIYDYVNAADSDAALKWYLDLRNAILSLEEYPNRWPAIHENGNLRHILYGNKPHIYRIIFRVLERQRRFEVLHIRHGSRGHFSRARRGR